MANGNFIPNEDAEYLAWLTNFAEQCSMNAPALQLTSAEVTQIEGLATTFETSFSANVAAKAAARSAAQQKTSDRRSTESVARRFAREFKANPGVSESLLALLGILSDSSSGPVTTVTNLTVVGCSDGVNQLRWDRNQNSNGTIFVVEFRNNLTAPWALAGVVTSVRFDHADQIPGEETWYRVTSTRAGSTSAPSPAVVVYGAGGSGFLAEAA